MIGQRSTMRCTGIRRSFEWAKRWGFLTVMYEKIRLIYAHSDIEFVGESFVQLQRTWPLPQCSAKSGLYGSIQFGLKGVSSVAFQFIHRFLETLFESSPLPCLRCHGRGSYQLRQNVVHRIWYPVSDYRNIAQWRDCNTGRSMVWKSRMNSGSHLIQREWFFREIEINYPGYHGYIVWCWSM